MKVSIITVCLNESATIQQTMESVLSQSHPDIEYLVLDGGSDDGTLDIINKFQDKINCVSSLKDEGMYFAINRGIAKASGEVVGILNANDFYVDNEVIGKVVGCFTSGESDSVYGDLKYVSQHDPNIILRSWTAGSYADGLFLKGWMPPHPTFFLKKKIYEKFGVYNTSFRSAADYELMLRLLHKHRISTAYLPEVLVNMRVGGKSNISLLNRIKANMEDRKAWKVNGLKPGLLTLAFKPLSKISQYTNAGKDKK